MQFFLWPNIRAETYREYRGYIIKYFVNCCEKEGTSIIYSLVYTVVTEAVISMSFVQYQILNVL
jgi:hypothetical protein